MNAPMPRPPLFVVPPSDAGLVASSRTGDQRALAALYDRHAPHVRRVALNLLGPDSELGDVLQEVFLVAFGRLAQLQDPERFRAWITGIAVHTVRQLLRHRRRRRWLRFVGDDALPELPATAVDAETTDVVRRTYAALAQLDDELRIAFALRFIEGMELSEAASAMGISLATYKRRLARAQQRFVVHARRDPSLRERLSEGDLR